MFISIINQKCCVMKNQMSIKLAMGVSGFVVITALFLLINPFASNNAGDYQIIQKMSGELVVQDQPQKWYWAGFFSEVTTYPRNLTIQVGPKSKRSPDTDYWEVSHTATFAGGDQAEAGHTVKWNLPTSNDKRIELHEEYTSYRNLMTTTLVQYQKETFNYSTQRMESESHYSGGNAKLKSYFDDQLRNGHVLTKSYVDTKLDSLTGEAKSIIVVEPEFDPQGKIQRNTSDIQKYGIIPTFSSIDYVDYDPRIKQKLQDKIDAAADKATAKERLITAQQEAEAAKVEGQKLIEETRAKELAIKEQAVIQAQKEKEVARQRLEQAKLDAAAELALKKAQAEGDKLKVAAGLTPKEKAEIEKATAIGVAAELAKTKFPQTMIFGGGQGETSPMEALGFEAMYKLTKEMSNPDK